MMFLLAALLAAFGMATTVRADRVGHDVAAGSIILLTNNVLPTLPTDASTEMAMPVAVNGFDFIQNHNISDHKIKIGVTEADDVALGVMVAAVSQNLRNNRGSNMTHTISVNPIVNSMQSYEIASQSAPLAGSGVASIEDNVNFAAAWFPFSTWIGGVCTNGGVNGANQTDWSLSPGLVVGTHIIDWKTAYALNGRTYIDLRPLGIDSRRDGVLLVTHAKNEANYAISQVNNADDEWDGTWTIQVRDNRSNGLEQDPVAWVFVPKSNTDVVSGMFTADASITMFSGTSPAFTVTKITSVAGTYELKVTGRSPADGVLIISGASGGGFNSDNIFTYEPNAAGDGWLIETRDLPACGLQNMDDTDVVCSFAFIPAEKPGVTVTPSKNLLTTEAGGTAQFTVTVNGYPKPTADVTITLSSTDAGEGTNDITMLTFTPADWNVPKTVTVTGVDDGIADGTQPYTITLSATTSADANYNNLPTENVSAINVDNEASINVDASSITTTEAGGQATFSVWLSTAPSDNVTLALSSSDTTEATVSPPSLTFTPGDYSTPQVVTVTGVDDFVQDGPGGYFVVTAVATSTDSAYNNFDALDIAGTNLDDDVAKVIVPAGVAMVTEPNTVANVPIVLNSQPTADVTINCTSTDTSEGTVVATVTFTPGNWNTPQNVVVTAADDLVNDGTVAYSIVTTVTSADPVYAAINPDDISVETVDNEADFQLPSGTLTYGIGDVAVGIDGYATVTDIDTADYSGAGGGVTVTITAGGIASDRLDVRNDGTSLGQIGVSGSTISYEGVNFATKSGGTGTTPLSITFNSAAATPAAAQALMRAITYQNVDANVAPGSRSLSFVLADGQTGVSTATKAITVRLMRVYSYQQEADGGFGVYTDALDTQIHHEYPTTAFPAGYSASGLWIDYDPASLVPTDQMQCFLRFTNIFGTGPGQIPLGSKIVYAKVIMNVTDSGHGALFNRMLIDWDESVTFDSLGNGVQLDNTEAVPGTNSFLGDQVHNTTTGGGLRTIGVTSDVQAWSDGADNKGWVMSPWFEGENGTAFSPCESTNILLRPRLIVGWVPAAKASVAAFQEGAGSYTGEVDTQVRLNLPDQDYSANTYLSPDPLVNATPIPNPQQVLVRFDNLIGSSAGQVPYGATIHAAVLELTSITADAQGAGAQFYRCLKAWNATDTWNIWVNGISTDGVEAALTPTVTLPEDGIGIAAQATKHNVEVTADVQAWANGSANNGWAVMPWDDGSNGWGFNSAEATPVDTRPLLRVYYTPGLTMGMPVYAPGSVQLPFNGAANTLHYVLRAPEVTGPWTTNGSISTDGNGDATYTDNSPLAGKAFYRVLKP